MIKINYKIQLFILLGLVLIIVYSQLLKPGLHVANDLPYSSQEIMSSFFKLPNAYSEFEGAFGANKIFTLWSWPYTFVHGFLSGMSVNLQMQLLLLGLIPGALFSSFGLWKLGKIFNLSPPGRIISVIFYLTNTYVLMVFDGGQLLWFLAYSFLPICFYLFEEQINSTGKNLYKPALAVVILGFFDIRAVFLFAFALLFRFVFQLLIEGSNRIIYWFAFYAKFAFLYITIFIPLNAYWLLPLFMTKDAVLPGSFTSLATADILNFTSLLHGIFLYQPHWYRNIFGLISFPKSMYVLIPLLVFSAAILRKKDLYVGYLLSVAVLSIFFIKGTQPPFGAFFEYLLNYLPGFFIFRDPTKFFVLIAFSYSLLLGIVCTEVIKKRSFFGKLNGFLPYAIIGYILILSLPIIAGKSSGLLGMIRLTSDFNRLENYLKTDSNFSKVLWIPNKPPEGFFNFQHLAINGTDLIAVRPFTSGIRGTYETLNFLREASYSGQLLDVAGVGYIAYSPLDTRKEYKPDQIKYHQTFFKQLSDQYWIKEKAEGSGIPLLKTKSNQDKFFIAPNIYFVVGSDSIYEESTKSATQNLKNNALIFAQENPEILNKINDFPGAKIINYKTDTLDVAASLIPKKKLIFPSKLLKRDPDFSGWWMRTTGDFISWKDFLKSKYNIDNQDFDYGGGWAVAEGDLKLQIPITKKSAEQILLARVMTSSRSGELAFTTGTNQTSVINTLNSGTGFRWFNLGSVQKNADLIEVSSKGEINVVNALALLTSEEWAEIEDRTKALISSETVVDFSPKKLELNDVDLKYRKINDSKYEIEIKNLNKPSILVYSQNFDENWVLNGKAPIKTYSFLNGFFLNQNGVYILEYKPQRYVEIGLLISTLSLVILLATIVYTKRFKQKNG